MSDIEEIIGWLDKNSTTQNIEELIEKTGKLATLSYYFGELTGSAGKEAVISEAIYKTDLSSLEDKYSETMSAAKAKSKAEAELRDAKLLWHKWQGEYTKNKFVLAQVNAVIDQMRQKISYLRKELRDKFES